MTTRHAPLRPWYSMTDREKAVWAAAYASHAGPGSEAADHAEAVVSSLAQSEWPEKDTPEHRAARLVRGLTLEQFRGWYVVELQLQSPSRPPEHVPDTQIEEAYTVYLMCLSDFS